MSLTIVLDTGPLSKVTHPKAKPGNDAVAQWLQDHLLAGTRIVIPEIADYELRREYLRNGNTVSIQSLEALIVTGAAHYEPVTTATWRLAADCWAQARQSGRPTAHDKALDADMLLVAIDDVGDLPHFVNAAKWSDIQP